MPLPRRCLLLDLIDDESAIAAYEHWHQLGNVPDAVLASIRASGITEMEIYRIGNRLVMLSETSEDFDPGRKAAADAANPDVMAWEALMGQFQQPLAAAPPGAKWVSPNIIFRLSDHPAG